MAALRLVYRSPWNVLLAFAAFVVMAAFYLWSSQVLVIGRNGISILIQTEFVVAALIMALLFGLLVPPLVYAARLAAASAAQTGGTAMGAIFGTVSMSCCAPVILPAILSLAGFSGTTILRWNETLNRFWLPLATAGIILLTYSLISVIHSLNLECSLNNSSDTVSIERAKKESVAAAAAERS
ncbi:MAG: hypothetical protein ACR2JC_05390 [Chloroflexota bacterium]|nr:MAG: hypothetical protein DLM70_04140 [Chloroflexota bacterium]